MRRTGLIILGLACVVQPIFAIAPNNGAENGFAFVGMKVSPTELASCIAIGRRVVMTARHVSLSTVSFDVNGAGTMYNIQAGSQLDVGTDTDIRLYRTTTDLPTWAAIDWAPITTSYNHDINFNFSATGGSSEQLRSAGYGGSGVLNGAGTGYNINVSGGTRRSARVWGDSRGPTTVGGFGLVNPSILSFLGVNGDGALVGGDSGGGLFRQVGSDWRLVGVNSFTGGNYMFNVGNQINHISGFAELAPWRTQIEAYLVPEPASLAVIGLGIAAMLRRRRK